jgi:hypothetical protein
MLILGQPRIYLDILRKNIFGQTRLQLIFRLEIKLPLGYISGESGLHTGHLICTRTFSAELGQSWLILYFRLEIKLPLGYISGESGLHTGRLFHTRTLLAKVG